jgi:NADPH-dependent 2,4-dienoyl-CoA reductase/sulfur reductase-like enzyme
LETKECAVAIVGGGPAGLAAAKAAAQAGAGEVAVIERDRELGGILQQCIHSGFGLRHFNEELTGPAYAERCILPLKRLPGVRVYTDTMALAVQGGNTVVTSGPRGIVAIKAGAVVLAMGCRERARGAVRIAGTRPAGVFTAGAAQRMVNMEGALPGNTAVILGSGDIVLIMARRLSIEGVRVRACLEIAPWSNGLLRNIAQCLDDYGIPLYLSHTISAIHGRDRVTGVTCVKVDEAFRPVAGGEFYLECDTVLLSVGLIPENELSRQMGLPLDPLTGGPRVGQDRQTERPGVFAAGNVLHVHDLADFASEEGAIAGRAAALYASGQSGARGRSLPVIPGDGLRTVVPQFLNISGGPQNIKLFARASRPKEKPILEAAAGGRVVFSRALPAARPSEMIVADLETDRLPETAGHIDIRLRQG